MTKRATKRLVREGEFDRGEFDDPKIRRLPVERGWSPTAGYEPPREQGYLKTIKAKSEDRKSTRLNSSHSGESRMPSSA